MIEIGQKIQYLDTDAEEPEIWIVTDNSDICNIQLEGVGFEGSWMDCFNSKCGYNVLDDIKFIEE